MHYITGEPIVSVIDILHWQKYIITLMCNFFFLTHCNQYWFDFRYLFGLCLSVATHHREQRNDVYWLEFTPGFSFECIIKDLRRSYQIYDNKNVKCLVSVIQKYMDSVFYFTKWYSLLYEQNTLVFCLKFIVIAVGVLLM